MFNTIFYTVLLLGVVILGSMFFWGYQHSLANFDNPASPTTFAIIFFVVILLFLSVPIYIKWAAFGRDSDLAKPEIQQILGQKMTDWQLTYTDEILLELKGVTPSGNTIVLTFVTFPIRGRLDILRAVFHSLFPYQGVGLVSIQLHAPASASDTEKSDLQAKFADFSTQNSGRLETFGDTLMYFHATPQNTDQQQLQNLFTNLGRVIN